MIPILEALQSLLVSDTAIADAVDDGDGGYRIYGPRRTMPEMTPPLPRTIVLQRVGGRRLALIPISRPRTYIRCYGATTQEAETLYGLIDAMLYDATGRLRGSRVVGTWLLYWAQLSEPDTGIEAVSGWPVSFGILESEWAAIAVA